MLSAMKALKLTKAHVWGVSLGSQIAVMMQIIDPGKIEVSFVNLAASLSYTPNREDPEYDPLRFTP